MLSAAVQGCTKGNGLNSEQEYTRRCTVEGGNVFGWVGIGRGGRGWEGIERVMRGRGE